MGIVVENFIGLSAPRFLGKLFSSLQNVREIRLAKCSPLPLLQARFNLTAAERGVYERALELRRRTGLCFWDAALLELPFVPDAVRLLDAAMMHVSLRGDEKILSWSEISSGGLERACAEFSQEGEASLTLLSEVVCRDGSIGHLPMLDFHAFKSPANQLLVEAAATRLFPDGSILLDSGESYHAYGTRIISQEDFRRFLGNAMLLAPIVDRPYVAHQLIEGRCALRLTQGGGKSRVPMVVAVLPKS
jgi:hypothetical protein